MNLHSIRIRIGVLALAASLIWPAWGSAEDTQRDTPQKKAQNQSSVHPLDPLSKEELTTATAVLKDAGKVADSSRFVLLHLHEPSKKDVFAYRPGKPLARQAFAVLYDWASNTTSEAIVDLTSKKLISWKNVPGAEPAVLPDDDHNRTSAIVRADAGWREAMKRRGITKLDKVVILGYPIGAYTPEIADGSRRAFVVMYSPEYGPIEDLLVLVDLTKKKIFKLDDKGVKKPKRKFDDFDLFDHHEEAKEPNRLPAKDPHAKARFQVHGHEVRGGHWRFRFAMHPRTGLVLHTVGYEDDGKLRSVLYRASLSEMVVPYGDPNWVLWSPFDAGEYGMGVYAKTSLNVGRDAPEDAAYFSAVLHDRKGAPLEVPRAVAIYERDGGVLWRHGRSAQRRGNWSCLLSPGWTNTITASTGSFIRTAHWRWNCFSVGG